MTSITSIKFTNFKALGNFSISLNATDIIVGPNNAGKSTIISSFRILESALRTARSKKPYYIEIDERRIYGHRLQESVIPVSLENVHTDYEEVDTKIEYRLSNSNRLIIEFPKQGGCILYWETNGKHISTTTAFKSAFPFEIQVVPVLGPIEHEEDLVTDETVKSSLGTPRASRHFRNFWFKNPDGFVEFKELIERTWPGMSIEKPEITSYRNNTVNMFCTENRISREIFWAGFGFQIWCQLLTHISRSKKYNLTVIDEPEVYLHPDLQRQILQILKSHANNLVVATHSVEIIGDSDPSEILLIDKTKRSAKRIKDIEGVQSVLDSLGSLQNISLTQLARNKKVLFVEGANDYRIIRRISAKMGLNELSSGSDITAIESGGFSSWEKIKSLAWGLKHTLGTDIRICALYDRDYWCKEQIEETLHELNQNLQFAHIHERKEIENYLLEPTVIDRLVKKLTKDRSHLFNEQISIDFLLEKITNNHKKELQSQYLSKYRDHHRKLSAKDDSTLISEALEIFEENWNRIEGRIKIVGGKAILKELREHATKNWGITLTDARIIDEYRKEEIPQDLQVFIKKLEEYRISS